MSARERLPPWHERQRLDNGRELLIRPIRNEDAQALRAGFTLLQPDEVRLQLVDSTGEPSAGQAEALTRIKPGTQFALVAADPGPPGEALIGALARISIDPGGRDAQFAILVSRHVCDMGLGRHLMTRLVKWSRGKRVKQVYGDVPAHNAPMLALTRSLGFQAQPPRNGLVRVTLEVVRSGDW